MPYCSWCLKEVSASVAEPSILTRNLLRCPECTHTIVECRACHNYACWDAFAVVSSDGSLKRFDQHDQFCGEHRHTVRNFERLSTQLTSPDQYRTVYDFRSPNLARASKLALCALGGVSVGGPLVAAAGPAIGGALGSAMGLSGAAATSAGLAAIGGGSIAAGGLGMAGGLAIVSVTGGALGGALGAYVAGSYLSDVKDFDIYKIRGGHQPAVITINGFLSQKGEGHSEWADGVNKRFPDRAWYHVEWEAKRLADLGSLCGAGTGWTRFGKVLTKAAKKAGEKAAKKLAGPLTAAQILALSTNPWHVAMVKAEKTGVLLADILSRCHRKRFILMGHSLGCRVIYSCLQTLATSRSKRVVHVHLFGGAVHNGRQNWMEASQALCKGGIISNYHSSEDAVLQLLYTAGTFFASSPIGRRPIVNVPAVINKDVSTDVSGHMRYKGNLTRFIE